MNDRYRVPELLGRIMAWERDFAPEVAYLETPTGLFLGIDFDERGGYFCTPVDAIPFARTGMDGIHYALLTDFGLAADLNEAPVIRISPMDSDRVRLVARNLRDFFSLQFYNEFLLFNEFASEEAYSESVRKEEAQDGQSEWFDHKRWEQEKGKVLEEVRAAFQIEPLPSPFRYMRDLRIERSSRVTVPTADSIGIMQIQPELPLDKAAFLASVRQLQHEYCTDRAVVERHATELVRLGMKHEAESLVVRLLS